MSHLESDVPDVRGELDLVGVLDVLLSYRWLILAVTLAFAILGTAYAFLAHPTYQADLMVQVEDSPDASAAKGLLGDVSSLFDVKSSAAAEAQILASRLVVSRAVDRLKSYIEVRPKRFPLIGDLVSRLSSGIRTPGLLGIGGYAWAQEGASVERFDVPRDFEGDKFWLTMERDGGWSLSGSDLDAPLRGKVGVESRFSTPAGRLTLLVTSFDAFAGTRFRLIRNSRTETIQNLQAGLDVQEKVKQSGVINATLNGDDADIVQRTLHEIGEQYVRQNIERKSADAAQSLSFLDVQMPQLKRQLEAAEDRYTEMRNRSQTVDLPEEAKLVLQQASESKTQLLLLQQKKDELSTRFNPAHPGIKAIDRQIAAMKVHQSGFETQIKRLPDMQQAVARLMLDVRVDTELYTALLNNAQQLQLVKAGKIGSVRLVDNAIVPEDPVKPKRPLVIGASLLLGLVAGIGVAFSRDLLFGGVSSPEEIERSTGLSVYATVPVTQSQRSLYRAIESRTRGAHLLARISPDDPAVESLRSFRTALRFSQVGSQAKVMLFTGAEPSAGKSFISVNLAAVLATAGKRVAIVDADLRRGYLNQYFGLGRESGLSELLSGERRLDETIRPDVVEDVDFISTGALPPNPGELLLSTRVPELIESLKSRYDYVLIDAPPVLAAADALLLAQYSDVVMLVARASQTRIADMRESVKRITHAELKTTGVVLNGVVPQLGGYGGKHGYYRYVQHDYGPRQNGSVRRLSEVLRRWGRG